MDGSDEIPNRICNSNIGESLNTKNIETNRSTILTKTQHWRGILMIAFLFLIFIAFILSMAYFLFRRCIQPSIPLINVERKNNYSTIIDSRML